MTTTVETIRNGVDTQQMYGTLDAIKAAAGARRASSSAPRNHWIDGAHNRTTIQRLLRRRPGGHLARRAVRRRRRRAAVLLGSDTGANPAEYLLHALAACLTTSLVYVAAARKVRLTEVESTLEGDMDVRGALGLSDEVRNGFEQIRVTFRVKGDAPPEKLREVVERAQARSAVFDIVTNGVPVDASDVASVGTDRPSMDLSSSTHRAGRAAGAGSPRRSPPTSPPAPPSTTATGATLRERRALKPRGYLARPDPRRARRARASSRSTTWSSPRAAWPAATPRSRSARTCTWSAC